MDVFFEGILKIFIRKSFDNDKGEHIEYNEAYFVGTDSDGIESVLKVNTKLDLSTAVDSNGVAKLQLQKDNKLRLISFTKERA